ncbi:TPA: hypothetical protein L4S95_005942 [Pseudomonas aeruginosa]|uniref:hypothetical protein n=1 Tax=Pseudomonas TaxID=286 RepID=UPI00038FD961|nr:MULTISPECIES: hypothetical protein [Pseudomonas]ARN50900.1 hypothetical protein A6748_05090 [Pseudomonas aeruginosa]AVN47686.1 hypothetical protein AM474_30610 [Pseudomonas aeruginosa]EIU5497171.1 hypothetical protein [Pseudomonas aeruginosa]EKD2841487.1 hypothetical protein [Pseudomonas aeruginosa]EKU0491848.1 hypothetical protein [Pseudomonas aeruginosa]
MSYLYSQEARERISALGITMITEFIEEVPHVFRKSFFDRQASIPGFRRGSPPEVKEKQRRLIGHLVHPQPGQKGEADWQAFASLWVAWAKSRLDCAFPAADKFPQSADTGADFFKRLAELYPDAPRETVERLAVYSGFAEDPAMQAVLNSFHPASTLARNRMIDGLPGRLDKIESYFELAETATEETAEHIDQLEVTVTATAEAVKQLTGSFASVDHDVEALRTALHGITERLQQLSELAQSTARAQQEVSQAIARSDLRGEHMSTALDSLSVQVTDLVAERAQVLAFEEALTTLGARIPDWELTAATIAALRERLDDHDFRVAKPRDETSGHTRVRLIENEATGPFVEVSSVDVAWKVIANNLQACGVVKNDANRCAGHILAAVISGQLIQFKGSTADLIADAVAAAVGGAIFHEWRVPVGLLSEDAAADCLEVVYESSGCLLLKGANRSAFEVYGSAIRDLVARRQFTLAVDARLVLIASWTHGPAAFPDGGTLSELGPVFDTDELSMRGLSAQLPLMQFGHLAVDDWRVLHSPAENTQLALPSTLRERLAQVDFVPGNLWLRVADRAYAQLRLLSPGPAERTLHAVLKQWALPWAQSLGGPVEALTRSIIELQSEIDTQAVHAEHVE